MSYIGFSKIKGIYEPSYIVFKEDFVKAKGNGLAQTLDVEERNVSLG